MIETWRCADCLWVEDDQEAAVSHALDNDHRVQGIRDDQPLRDDWPK